MSSVFPQWMNKLPPLIAGGATATLVLVVAGGWYYLTPDFDTVGYQPTQPVAFSHLLHAGQLGIDCRYCHTKVEVSPHSNVPDTATCMNCHTGADDQAYLNNQLWSAHKNSVDLRQVREAYASGKPIQWRRIHKVPDYVHFNHAVHVNAGVSCYSCHGRMDRAIVAKHEQSLAMGWCLNCHRAPEKEVVNNASAAFPEGVAGAGPVIKITDLPAVSAHIRGPERETVGRKLVEAKQLQPPQMCAACHY
ncbi:MAG: cytochrome c3 family protein [Phycisphaerales bacterium]|nr:cytochrome c3 family protein [Phycisphaerales bacterium]